MNSQIQLMLERYDCSNIRSYENALKEIIQEVILSGLARNGFFQEAAFCGGTALRIFHGLDRFSEDLDFSLLRQDSAFDLTSFLPSVRNELWAYGFEMTAEKKEKNQDSVIQTAFVKGNTLKLLMQITPLQPPVAGIIPTQKTRIKLEVDTTPPAGAKYEYRYSLLPMPYQAKLLDLPSMFSGKIHAILCRNYTKGRDLYDFVWYVQHGILWNQDLLYHALCQTNVIPQSSHFQREDVYKLLSERFSQTDFEEAKKDIRPFVNSGYPLELWSRDFFMQILSLTK